MATATDDATLRARRDAARWALCLAMLLGLLVAAFAAELLLGSARIPLSSVLRALLGLDVERESWLTIVRQIRLPRAGTAMLSGAALAVCGLQMQTLFRNPLADPFVLGISSGASLGVALVLLLAGTGPAAMVLGAAPSLALAATLGAAAAFLAVVAIARRVESNTTLLILGLMFGYATGSVVSILLHFGQAERVKSYVAWTFGSFAGVTGNQLWVLAGCVGAGLFLAVLMMKPLNALLLGPAYARSMGLDLRASRAILLAGTSLLAGSVVAFCGPVGFLGIAVPHLCRGLLRTADHRVLVPGSALLGAVVAMVADLAAQLPGSDRVLPLNSVTALLGAPIVIWVVLRARNLGR